MRAAWAARERTLAVRDAARSWQAAGVIDERTLWQIKKLYPDARTPLSTPWQVMIFFFGTFAVWGLFGAIAATASLGNDGIGYLSVFFGAGLAVATEWDKTSGRFSPHGIEQATALWSAVFAVMACGFLVHTHSERTGILWAAAAFFGVSAWRWGAPALAAIGVVSLFFALGEASHPRLLWLVVGALLAAAASRLLDRPTLAPSHRRCAAAVLVVSLLALYLSVNRYLFDNGGFERLLRFDPNPDAGGPPTLVAVLAWIATAAVPIGLVLWGFGSRRTLLLDLGILTAALSLVTLRFYVHVAPLWVVLTGSGALLAGASMVVNRWLTAAPEGEIRGFTADALFTDEAGHQGLLAVATVAAYAPHARAAPERDSASAFRGGGGDSGGAGASDSF